MQAAKVQASLRIRAALPEPPLLAHTSSESRGTFRQKARPLAPLNGWACAVKICNDRMLEDTNSLDGAQIKLEFFTISLSNQIWLIKLLKNLWLCAVKLSTINWSGFSSKGQSKIYWWMVWPLMSFSAVFQSYQDRGIKRHSNQRSCDLKLEALTTCTSGHFKRKIQAGIW